MKNIFMRQNLGYTTLGIIVFGIILYIIFQSGEPNEKIGASSLVILAATMIVMFQQNRIAQSASDSQNILSLVQYLMADDHRKARTRVIRNLNNKTMKKWKKKDIWAADKVCSSYALAGTLIRRGYVEGETFFDDWGTSIKSTYKILKDHLGLRRTTSDERYWDEFDWLYTKVLEWECKNVSDAP